MSVVEVPVVRVDRVEDHPNADRLSLVYFCDYITISAKLDDGSHRYNVGDLTIYVPEAAIVPEYLLRQGFWDEKKNQGILAGSKGNRVKAIKLRGILSQGIMFPVTTTELETVMYTVRNEDTDMDLVVQEGDDVSKFLGIEKYEPPIPTSMAGDVVRAVMCGHKVKMTTDLPKFDLENIKKWNRVLEENENVVITEKLHGTQMGIGYIPGLNNDELWGDFFCFSKGLGGKGLVFKNNEKNRESNVYVKIMEKLLPNIKAITSDIGFDHPAFIYGEVFGSGVQDLTYGYDEPVFRMFDTCWIKDGRTVWAGHEGMELLSHVSRIPTVPILYSGPWSRDLLSMTDGKSTMAGHIREGIVIKTTQPRYTRGLGRVILKSVSEAYLTRKNATEYN
jgi:RNA ligase (TIGR02306 family)